MLCTISNVVITYKILSNEKYCNRFYLSATILLTVIMERSRPSSQFERTDFNNSQVDLYDQIKDFERLRISALSKAAEISPLVTEVTIGPNSPTKREKSKIEKLSTETDDEIVNLIQDKIGEDLRYTLLLKEHESKLQENSEDLFKNLVEKMITSYTETMHGYWKKQNDKWKCKSLELRARKLQMAKQLQENDNLNILEIAKLDEKKCEMISSQTLENMNKILEEQNNATIRLASLTESHMKIGISYNEITCLTQIEPFGKNVLEKYSVSINSIIGNISVIMDFCKTGTITDKEIKQAEILSRNIDNIKQEIIKDINILNRQQDILKERQEEEIKKKEFEKQRAQEEKVAQLKQLQQEQIKKMQQMFYSDKNYSYYIHLSKFLDVYEGKYADLVGNVSLKKFRFDCQKAVNTPINALSSVSGVHMRDKYNKLAKLLRGECVQVLDTHVTATQHPQGLYYCTALLAKKIVRQGDLLVSSNPEAAFPLATVTAALWSQFPEFGKLLEAYFHRHCPYLVPMLLPHKEGQTDKEFYLSRGYTYNDEGQVEKQDKFLKRMSGIFRLRCAIWIAKTPRFLNASNPHGLRFGWHWLSSFINLKPEPDICATLLLDFFAVCGSEFLKCYSKQFIKIIKLINSEYLTILQNIDEGGPKTRLDVFLQNVLITSSIPTPSGLIPSNAL